MARFHLTTLISLLLVPSDSIDKPSDALNVNNRREKQIFQLVLKALIKTGVIQIIALSPKGRITQFAERTEFFVRRKKSRRKWFPPILIAVHYGPTSNIELERYLTKQMVFISKSDQRWLARTIRRWALTMPGEASRSLHLIYRQGWPWDLPPAISTRDDWRRETDELLEKMEVDPQMPIVLLAVRDKAYYLKLRETHGSDAGIETSMDTMLRNPDIATYSLAISRLRERGFAVVYFGYPTSPLPQSLVGDVIDYSNKFRSPRGDLILGRRCSMMLNGSSGAWVFPSLFNRPIAFTNLPIFFAGGYSSRDRNAFQLLQDKETGRIMSFREMAEAGWRYSYHSNCLKDGVSLVKNSPELIAEVALEVLDRSDGKFLVQPGDRLLHKQFEQIRALGPKFDFDSIPATTFLRRYADLLEKSV